MADRIFDPDIETPNQQVFDGGWHTLGSLAGVEGTPELVGGAAWFPTPVPENFFWLVYDTLDESIVAQVDLNVAVPDPVPGWNSFTSADFDAPGDVTLADGEGRYAVVVATNGDFVYLDSGIAYPYGDGSVIAAAGCFHNGGSGPVFPGDTTLAAIFFADMFVQAGGATHDGDGAADATGSASGSATVDRNATGTADATGTTSATATVDRQATATASVTATVTATATINPGGPPPEPDGSPTFTVGQPRGRWHVGKPHGRWRVGQPRG